MNTSQGVSFEPLVNQFQPGKLADLSAVSLVAGLTHKNLVRIRRDTNTRTDYSSPKLDEIGSIPKSIRSTLKKLISRTCRCWSAWWLHHHKNVFFEDQDADDLIDCFDLLVWLPNATINYEQTAIKLLSSDRLTKVQQFQLACAYCLIDDMKRVKRTLTNNEMEAAIRGHRSNRHAFLNYWSRRMNLNSREKVSHVELLLELILTLGWGNVSDYDLRCYDEWPAINFFLSRMREQQHSLKIKDIIGLGIPRLTWLLLPTLSEIDCHSIISKEGSKIMETLLKKRYYSEFTMSVWKQIIHVIDNIKLVQIIRHVNNLEYERSYVNDLLWRMWLALSDFQKGFIAEEGISNFIETSLNKQLEDYSLNFPLIMDVLSRSSRQRRQFDWWIHWPYLVIGQLDHRERIDHIMKLCFDNDQQIEDFKKTSMIDYESISKYCNVLLKQRRIKDVQTYTEFCTSDSQIVRRLKKTIIREMPKIDLFDVFFRPRKDDAVADFNRYLDDVFTENERRQFFDEMVTNHSVSERMRLSNNLDDVIKFIETFVSSEKSLIDVKINFLEHFRYRGCESSSDLDLMAWCLNGDKSLVKSIKETISAKTESEETSSADKDVEESFSNEDEDEVVPEKKIKLKPWHKVFKIFMELYRQY